MSVFNSIQYLLNPQSLKLHHFFGGYGNNDISERVKQNNIFYNKNEYLNKEQVYNNEIYYYGNTTNNRIINTINNDTQFVLDTYDRVKNTFYTELKNNTNELSNAIDDIKQHDFNLQDDANKDDELQNSLNLVKNLVDNYNTNIDFFNKNSDISNRISYIHDIFGDTKYNSSLYKSIGINVDIISGELSINRERLIQAIINAPNNVNNILYSLANKAEQHLNIVDSQYDKLFPDITKVLGINLENTYINNAQVQTIAYMNIGNLINFLF